MAALKLAKITKPKGELSLRMGAPPPLPGKPGTTGVVVDVAVGPPGVTVDVAVDVAVGVAVDVAVDVAVGVSVGATAQTRYMVLVSSTT